MEEQLRAGEESDGQGGSKGAGGPAQSPPAAQLCSLSSDWLQCAYLEASNCQVESRYLGVLRQLQDTRSLDPVQRRAVQRMIEDALKGELKSVVKLNMAR